MSKRKFLIIFVFIFILLLLVIVFIKFLSSLVIKGEVVFISDNTLLLSVENSSHKYIDESVYLNCKDTSKFEVGDKLMVFCSSTVALSDPPYVDAIWIYRYRKTER